MSINPNSSPSKLVKPNSSPFQYVSEYDINAFSQNQIPITSLPFTQPSFNRDPYHMSFLPQNNTNASQNIQTGNGTSRVKSQASRFVSSQVTNQQLVKGESRVSYVPYEKKVIEYQNRTYVERVPIKKKVTKYEQRKVVETIPREVIKQDYYAVEKRVEYHKEIIPQKRVEYVSVQKKIKRYEYVPVQKQIVHYPENVDIETAKAQSRVVLKVQGVDVKPDAQFKPINPTLLYNYSDRPSSKYNPILYHDEGIQRVFSTAPTLGTPQYSYDPRYPPSFVQTNQSSQLSPRFVSNIQNGSLLRQQFQPQGQSYIKELVSSNARGDLKRPFEIIQQSKQQKSKNYNIGVYDDYGNIQQNEQQSQNGPSGKTNFHIDEMDRRTQK